MIKNMSSVRLGLFIFLGTVLLIIAVFLVGQKSALFSSTFTVRAYFKDIQGLRVGANVRLSGIDVGNVQNVKIVNDTTGRVEVSLNLQTDIQRFIRTDTKATIETEGLVGNKVVVLEIGSSTAEPVAEGGVIQTKEPLSFSEIIAETQGVMKYTKEMTKDLSEIVHKVNKGEGSIGKLINDNELYNAAASLTANADRSLSSITGGLNRVTGLFDTLGVSVKKVVKNVNNIAAGVDTILNGVREGKGVLGSLIVEGSPYDTLLSKTMLSVQKTAEDSRIAASRLAENMEALKHNWLFKSYFENRGYWDKSVYEDQLDSKIKELNDKIKLLDEKISKLKSLEKVTNK